MRRLRIAAPPPAPPLPAAATAVGGMMSACVPYSAGRARGVGEPVPVGDGDRVGDGDGDSAGVCSADVTPNWSAAASAVSSLKALLLGLNTTEFINLDKFQEHVDK